MAEDPIQVTTIPNDYGIYLPLDRSKDQIRLLWIRPECEGPDIVCYLRIISLETAPGNYACLSYCWGDLTDTAGIQLVHCFVKGDQELGYSATNFRVTKNLEVALKKMRQKDQEWPIWIDALCVNQSDIEERNHQVGFMRQVYSKASSVIIWLGDDDPYSVTAIRFATTLHTIFQEKCGGKKGSNWFIRSQCHSTPT